MTVPEPVFPRATVAVSCTCPPLPVGAVWRGKPAGGRIHRRRPGRGGRPLRGAGRAGGAREVALNRELFVPAPAPSFERRLGDVILCHRTKAVWHPPEAFAEVGQHGGLSEQEMRVPFAVVYAADL